MKKIFTLVLAFLLTMQFTVFAGNYTVMIKRELDASSQIVQNILVEGTLNQGEFQKGDQITVRILPQDKNAGTSTIGDYLVIGQTTVNEDGSFSIEKQIAASKVNATVSVVAGRTSLSDTNLYIPDMAEIEALVAGLNNGTIAPADVLEKIATDNKNLCFDVTIFNNLSNKTAVVTAMQAELGTGFNIQNIYESFDKHTLLQALTTSEADTAAILAHYESELFLKTQKEYPLFTAFSPETKETVYSMLQGKVYTDYAAVQKAFFEAVILTSVKAVTSYLNIFDILKDYQNEIVGITADVAAMEGSDVVKDTVTKYLLKNKNKINSLDNLKSELAYAVANYREIRASEQQSQITSSGGSGGPSYVTDNIPKPDIGVGMKYGFTDLNGFDWAKPAIDQLYRKGIIAGKESDKYAPQDNVTRSEFVKMISIGTGVYDKEATCSFEDIKGHWGESYVASAFQKGYVSGVSRAEFAPDQAITRQDAIVILYRILVITVNAEMVEDVREYVFEDSDRIADYARNSAIMMNAYDIVNGFEDNTFRPENNLSRAEAAVLIDNFLTYIEKGE